MLEAGNNWLERVFNNCTRPIAPPAFLLLEVRISTYPVVAIVFKSNLKNELVDHSLVLFHITHEVGH